MTPIAMHEINDNHVQSGCSDAPASFDVVGDGVGSARDAPGVMVVVGPNGYGMLYVETETPSGPRVIVSPSMTVVVGSDPGPTV